MEESEIVRAIILMIADGRQQRHLIHHARQRREEFFSPLIVPLSAPDQIAGVKNKFRRMLLEVGRYPRMDFRKTPGVAIGYKFHFSRVASNCFELFWRRAAPSQLDRIIIERAGLQVG